MHWLRRNTQTQGQDKHRYVTRCGTENGGDDDDAEGFLHFIYFSFFYTAGMVLLATA